MIKFAYYECKEICKYIVYNYIVFQLYFSIHNSIKDLRLDLVCLNHNSRVEKAKDF